MAGFKEYDYYDGLGLAELVRTKEVSPAELLEEAIQRAETHNPELNAIITPMFEEARKTAQSHLTGPFAGVPFLLKDLHQAYAGVPMSNGSAAYRDYIPTQDDELVRRYKKAGLVIFGKTNTPEFGLMGVTEPEAFGPTRNPWNPARSPGGSSGGSAAAVAVGIVPMASASDGGGSIRIPAAACGLFGLKPTRGRVPVGPGRAEKWDGAGVNHVISRTVRDSAAMLDEVSGPEIGAPYTIPGPARPYMDEIQSEPRKLRIAYTTRSPLGTEVESGAAETVRKTVGLLETLGHEVEEAQPALDGWTVARAYLTMYFGQAAADLRAIERTRGKHAAGQVEQATRMLAVIGRSLSSGEYVEARRSWHDFAQSMVTFHETYDLYLTPTTAFRPVLVGSLALKPAERFGGRMVEALGAGRLLIKSGMIEKVAERSLSKTPFTQLANLTGQPAMSVPVAWAGDGTPLGVQFVAPWGDEATLFQLAAQLEKSNPWFDRRPPMAPQIRGRTSEPAVPGL